MRNRTPKPPKTLPRKVLRSSGPEGGGGHIGGDRLQAHVQQNIDVLTGGRHLCIVVLALVLVQKLVPAFRRTFQQLGDTETQRAHKVIATRPVPVPDLHQQAAVLVVRLQVKGERLVPLGVEAGLDGSGLPLALLAAVLRH